MPLNTTAGYARNAGGTMYTQNRYNTPFAPGAPPRGGGYGFQQAIIRKSAMTPSGRTDQRSLQTDIAIDQAQRAFGLNPEDAVQGARFTSFGGKTYQTTGKAAGFGSYEDTEVQALGDKFVNYLTAVEAQKTANLSDATRRDWNRQYGFDTQGVIGHNEQKFLADEFAKLTDAQRQMVFEKTGLGIDKFVEQFGAGGGRMQLSNAGTTAQEVSGYDPNAYKLGEHRLRESIGQAQASRGLYGSYAAASAEAAAVSALQGAQRQALAPWLAIGMVDPRRAGIESFYGVQGADQMSTGDAAYFGRYGVGPHDRVTQGVYDAQGQWRASYATEGADVAAAYGLNNPLAYLQRASTTYAAAFGA